MKDLKDLEKVINSELASKIQNSFIKNNELTIEINDNDLLETIQFLKSNEKCKYRQLIDIAGVDYPDSENDFNLFICFYHMNIILELKSQPSFNLIKQ